MARNVTTKSTFSTSEGASRAAGFANPVAKVTAVIHSTGSTGTIMWKIQGALGQSGWVNLSTAITSTGVSMVSSTAAHIVDKARIDITTNNSTAPGTVWITGV